MAEKKGFFGEFKEFISKGNVLDMAVGIVIGTAFTAIINSLVNDILMPLLGKLTGGLSFDQWKFVLTAATDTTPEIAVCYGNLISKIINFLLFALCMFFVVKSANRFRLRIDEVKSKFNKTGNSTAENTAPKEAAAPKPVEPTEEILLLREIRDSLKK